MTRTKRAEIFGQYPLSPQLKAEKLQLLAALQQFWASAAFTHGWSTPPFAFHDVKPQVDEAADIATRIRAHCLRKHPQMRTGPGAAVEYLWSLHSLPQDKDKFVEALVEAIFSNTNGFEAPLDESLVARYIAEIRELRKQHKHKPVHVLKSEWAATELLLDEVIHSGEVTQQDIDGVVGRLKELNTHLEAIARRNKDVAEAASRRQAEEAADEARTRAAAKAAADEAEAKQQRLEQEEAEKAEKQAAEEEKAAAEEEEAEDSSDSSDERKRMKESIDRNALNDTKLLELQRISSKTNEIARDVQSFEEVDLKRLDETDLSDEERDGLISRLHKRSMQYALLLEQELLQLDAISGENVRALRKEQVAKIQEALHHVDGLQKRLKNIHAAHQEVIDKKREEERAKNPPSPEPKAAPALPAAAASAPGSASPPAAASPPEQRDPEKKAQTLLEKLASQKLEVQFQIKDRPGSFLISAYVPGIDEDSLTVSLNDEGDLLTCTGLRLPTQQELQALRGHPAVARFRNPEEGVLRLAAGRFGRFSEKWRMDPQTVIADKVTAGYNSGVLEIVVPKKQRPQQQQQQRQRVQPRNPFYW